MTFPPLIIDTREQLPWIFPAEVQTVVRGLPAGDYSLMGFETEIAIERKSLNDFVACCTSQRERFVREIEKLAQYDFAAIVIEADIGAVWSREYTSRAVPQSIAGSAAAFTIDYRIPVVFAGCPSHACDFALRLLRKWHERRLEREVAA